MQHNADRLHRTEKNRLIAVEGVQRVGAAALDIRRPRIILNHLVDIR
jgi:hypothetical protein